MLGADLPDVAKEIGVGLATIKRWMAEHDEFRAAIKRGKDRFDTNNIEGALRCRAMGCQVPETKVFCFQGEIIREEVTKYYPPDVAAIVFWLKNRQPDRWRDKRHYEHEDKVKDEEKPTKSQLLAAKKQIIAELESYDDKA